jgi:hypothetical protein
MCAVDPMLANMTEQIEEYVKNGAQLKLKRCMQRKVTAEPAGRIT